VLSVGHNQLAALPAALLGLAGLRELVAGHNLIAELAGPIHLMESLQVRWSAGRVSPHILQNVIENEGMLRSVNIG
jgi:Leucine-rich repeat (LRR) protein